jgi:hypothetical protein
MQMTLLIGSLFGSAAYLSVWRIATKAQTHSPARRNASVAVAVLIAVVAGLVVVLSDQLALMFGFALGSVLTQVFVYRHRLFERFR